MKKTYFLLVGLLVLHLFFLFNLRFTAWPEMVSYAYLRNHGFLLYRDMIYPYPPLLTIALSLIYKVFGYKLIVLRIVTWGIILVNDVLIFAIAKKLSGKTYFASLSLLFYIATQPFLEGNQLWFDLTVVPPILLATYYLLQKSSTKNLIIAGFALGIAALIKQTAGLYLGISILYVVYRDRKLKSALYLLMAPVVLGFVFVLRLTAENSLTNFVNWALIYPFAFWGKFPGYIQMVLSKYQLAVIMLLVLPVMFLLIKSWKNFFADKSILLITCYLLISFVLVYPRFSFFHLQAAIAFAAIFFGVAASKLKLSFMLLATYYLLLFVFIIIPPVRSGWGKEARFWSGSDLELAKVISGKVDPNEKVYLLGLPSTLYAFADRLPPKPWTDNFGWYLEIPGVQDEIISGWYQNPPEKIVWQKPQQGNWFDLGTYQPKKITGWIAKNYTEGGEIAKGVTLWIKRK